MNSISTLITEYLDSCRTQKCLDEKTLKAYRIDLRQFSDFISDSTQIEVISDITSETLESYISRLHAEYKPKTAKRKIASIKALFHYCEYKDLIDRNPFSKIHTRFREPVILPKTIPLHIVESFLSTIYTRRSEAGTAYQRRNALRDAAVIELLFSSGIRISELCNLKNDNVNLIDGTILIYGKGDKERYIQLASDDVIHILDEYRRSFSTEISSPLTCTSPHTCSATPSPPAFWKPMSTSATFRKCSDTAQLTSHRFIHMSQWGSREIY